MNAQFLNWFRGSGAVDERGNPMLFYHGASYEFDHFDITKIRADETDAVYNGFWFTSERSNASPAWRDPKYIKTVYLRLCNPAPHELARKIYRDVRDNPDNYKHLSYRSYHDAVRFELQRLGFDGMIHNDRPLINLQEFQQTGQASYLSARGNKYTIKLNTEYGGVDLYGADADHITGYEDLQDFFTQHNERTLVVFDPRQIFVVKTDKVG